MKKHLLLTSLLLSTTCFAVGLHTAHPNSYASHLARAKVLAAAPKQAITDLAKPVLVKKGQKTFSVTLKSNPTTGYRWYLARLPARLVKAKSYRFNPPTSQLVGAPGSSTWTFKLSKDARKAPRLIKLVFVYARSFDPKDMTVQKVMVFTGV